jgi:hypothetical protein
MFTSQSVADLLTSGKEWPVMTEWPECLSVPLPDKLIDELQPLDTDSRKARLCEYVSSTVYFNGQQGVQRFTIADPRLAKKFKKWLSRTASNLPKKSGGEIHWTAPGSEPKLVVQYPRVDFESACAKIDAAYPGDSDETREGLLNEIRERAVADYPTVPIENCEVQLV